MLFRFDGPKNRHGDIMKQNIEQQIRDLQKTIGLRCKNARKALGLSRVEVIESNGLDMSEPTYKRFEDGTARKFDIIRVYEICGAMSLSASDLMFSDGNARIDDLHSELERVTLENKQLRDKLRRISTIASSD